MKFAFWNLSFDITNLFFCNSQISILKMQIYPKNSKIWKHKFVFWQKANLCFKTQILKKQIWKHKFHKKQIMSKNSKICVLRYTNLFWCITQICVLIHKFVFCRYTNLCFDTLNKTQICVLKSKFVHFLNQICISDKEICVINTNNKKRICILQIKYGF